MINHERIQEMALKAYWLLDLWFIESPARIGNEDNSTEVSQALYALDRGWSE